MLQRKERAASVDRAPTSITPTTEQLLARRRAEPKALEQLVEKEFSK